MKHTKSYEPGHPNPRFYRPNWRSLNGQWAFLFDDEDKGIDLEFFNSFPTQHQQINVPYAYEAPGSGIDDKSEHNILWYKTTFTHLQIDKLLLLHIERSDYHTTIWLNGKLVGDHLGGYDAFSFVLNEHAIIGENNLVIRVYDSKDARQPRGKQTWKETPFECFYHGTSGIYGDVWLEWVDDAYLVSVEVGASFENKKLNVKALLSQKAIGNKLVVTMSFNGVDLTKETVLIKQKEVEFAVDIPLPLNLWSVDTPHLYDLKFDLKNDNQQLDSVLSYFGINSVSIYEQNILLNGRPTFLKFVLDQGYFPNGDLTGTYEDFMIDINYLKAAGFNGVRKHEKVESKLFYYLADRYGLLNWLELPSPHKFDLEMKDTITKQWQNIIAQNSSYPSLMAYVSYNESWGIHEVKNDIDQQKMATHLYHEAKRLDPTRLSISNDGWEHTISDLLTVHNYQESKEDLLATYKELKPLLNTVGNAPANTYKNCYAGGYKYRGEPLVFSEFAGIAIDSNTSDGWGYGKAANGIDDFFAKLQGQIEAINEIGLFSGWCITQLTDVYQEKNGLMTQDRKIKIDPHRLKTII